MVIVNWRLLKSCFVYRRNACLASYELTHGAEAEREYIALVSWVVQRCPEYWDSLSIQHRLDVWCLPPYIPKSSPRASNADLGFRDPTPLLPLALPWTIQADPRTLRRVAENLSKGSWRIWGWNSFHRKLYSQGMSRLSSSMHSIVHSFFPKLTLSGRWVARWCVWPGNPLWGHPRQRCPRARFFARSTCQRVADVPDFALGLLSLRALLSLL